MKAIFLFVFIILLSSSVFAQTTKDVNVVEVPQAQFQTKKKVKKFTLFKKKQMTDREEHEAFRKRMAATKRKKDRELIKADKPQYTDPLYFGHKKPPKKRKLGKRKFCKECGLIH